MNLNLYDIKTIKELMELHKINFRKEFGQNFLTNPSVTSDIADNCCDDTNQTILEIGPGIGTLTRELAKRYKNVLAIEIDRGLIPLLGYTLSDFENVTIINEDVMKVSLSNLLSAHFENGKISVCANLPYYITTPVLMRLLESEIPFEYITIMIQSEVADRLCAAAGAAEYGAITAVLAYYGTIEKLFDVSAGNFIPRPKVDSSVVRIKLYNDQNPYCPKDKKILFRTIRSAFEQRRKTLPNSLSAGFPELSKQQLTEAIIACGHKPDIRGEKLDINQFVTLANKIYDSI